MPDNNRNRRVLITNNNLLFTNQVQTKANYSYYFDGSTRWVSFGDILNTYLSGSTPIFSFRNVLRKLANNAQQTIIGKYDSTTNNGQLLVRFNSDNTIQIITTSDGTAATKVTVTSTSTFTSTSTWYDIVITFDGTQSGINKFGLIVNGVSQSLTLSSGTPGAIFAGSASLIIGAINEGASNLANYWSNQEGITSDIITVSEAVSLYNNGNPMILPDICDNVKLSCIHNNDTFSTNWTLIDDISGNNGTSAGMIIVDRDNNEIPY